MSESHAAGWPSDAPTAAQMKEVFDQIDRGDVTSARVQMLIRGQPEPSNVFISGKYPVLVHGGPGAIREHLRLSGFEGNIDPQITDENYPQGPSPAVSHKLIQLAYFGRKIGTEEVLRWCSAFKFQAIGPAALLGLGAKHRQLGRYRIVALGQTASIKQPRGHYEDCAVCFQTERQMREAWTLPEYVWKEDDPDIYFAVESI